MSRDVGSFDEFCSDHWARLVRALTLQLGERGSAEELAQEAFVRAAVRWNRVRRMDDPAAWVRHVAMNLARSAHRGRASRDRAMAALAGQAQVHRRGLGDEAVVVDGLVVRRALLSLDAGDRQIIVLRYFFGVSTAEAARELGISEGAARTRLSRSLDRLATLLGDEQTTGAVDAR